MATDCPIFISYRRADLSLEAEWLHALISSFFGEGVAFLDRREITAGTRWDDTLEQSVRAARLVLVLIGPAWLKVQSPSGMRRLDDPEDWVRREVATAMAVFAQQPGRTRVFPVLVNGATPIPRDWLPDALADLASFQWEPDLQFQLRDYLDHAANIHAFLAGALRALPREGPLANLQPRPFKREQVPSPYDIAGYPLPEALRLRRPAQPFRGLSHFGRDDAAIFFGRHREIAEIIDAFKKGRNFLRLYGPTGTGKSSLLFAGLLPRLEGRGWRLSYQRRDPVQPAAATLERALQALNAGPDEDALVILDQVEEILTAPNPAAPTELQDLVAAVAKLDTLNATRTRPVRLLWAYRKEYDGNLKAALREAGVSSGEYWLRNLDADGMREAITGIVRDHDLQAEYHLEIEPGLETLIVAELLERSAAESVTPLLQMLLRRMWDRASADGADPRRFTRDLYEACKSTDLLQLVQERLAAVAAGPNATTSPQTAAVAAGPNPTASTPTPTAPAAAGTGATASALAAAVASGQALDLLERLVSEQDTCLSLPQAELTGVYDDPAAATRLVQALVDRYLLVRGDDQRCRLPHDTLARAVRVLHARSALPGQRASRLLDSKADDIRRQPDAVDFSLTDLRTLDEGRSGMRRLSAPEQQAVDLSRQRRQQEQADLQQKNEQLADALARAEREMVRAKVAELRGLKFRMQAMAGSSIGEPASQTEAAEAPAATTQAEAPAAKPGKGRTARSAAAKTAATRTRGESAEAEAAPAATANANAAIGTGTGSGSDSLQDEIRQIDQRLAAAQRAHQDALARAIGFRGDFDFLMRWEGVAGSVKMLGPSAYIDPLTDLAHADAQAIRARYEFLLSPAELQGVVGLVGQKDDAAQQVFAAHPALERIRLTASDVAQLVPDVVEPWWRSLLRRQPDLARADTPGEVHTALLSLAVNMGPGPRVWALLQGPLAARDWAALADAIEHVPMPRVASALQARRREEAELIRGAAARGSSRR